MFFFCLLSPTGAQALNKRHRSLCKLVYDWLDFVAVYPWDEVASLTAILLVTFYDMHGRLLNENKTLVVVRIDCYQADNMKLINSEYI